MKIITIIALVIGVAVALPGCVSVNREESHPTSTTTRSVTTPASTTTVTY